MEHWRGEVGRVGRGDRRGGVYRVGNFDHDGNELTPSELARLDERDAVEEPPMDWEERLKAGRGDSPSGVYRVQGYDHDGNPISAVEEARLNERDEGIRRRRAGERDLSDD